MAQTAQVRRDMATWVQIRPCHVGCGDGSGSQGYGHVGSNSTRITRRIECSVAAVDIIAVEAYIGRVFVTQRAL